MKRRMDSDDILLAIVCLASVLIAVVYVLAGAL